MIVKCLKTTKTLCFLNFWTTAFTNLILCRPYKQYCGNIFYFKFEEF